MTYLTGEQISKKNIKTFIGKKVIYLFNRDIDKSGRGYFFPRIGTITQINGKTIDFDNKQEFNNISTLAEIVLANDDNLKTNFNKI